MAPLREHFDTVIIGAGMSGLAAGIRLAQFDQDVLIVDRHSLWGGLNSFYKLAGRRFDVGLHALTNFVPPRTKGRPLTKILRQLRLSHADLKLGEQSHSAVAFPGVSLRFANGFGLLEAEIAEHFPRAIDGFRRLLPLVADYPDLTSAAPPQSARAVLAECIDDPLLVDMLLLPILYYGSPTAYDLEWSSFVILFKSLYEEGFARPEGGVRRVLDLLRSRYKELGGELWMRNGVCEIVHANGRASGVVLDDGSEITAGRVLSSAGWVETMRLAGSALEKQHVPPSDVGRMTFVESISVLDTRPADLGHDATITFFNATDELVYDTPEEAVDYRSGVICCPDNYVSEEPAPEGTLRLTLLANYDRWTELAGEEYYPLKDQVWEQAHGAITGFAPDVRPHTVFRDVFTPRTIEKFTGHVNGAVYGSPNKRKSGTTPLANLFICGTDQGYLGIVGAMLSGIAVANHHALVPVS